MRKNIDLKKLTIAASLAGAVCLLPQFLLAKASGPCVDCHTMHNSQGGVAVDSDGPNGALTNDGGCIGCHTGTNDGGNIPYIQSDSGEPTYDATDPAGSGNLALAGGSFFWATDSNDTKGHNVFTVTGEDDPYVDGAPTPPGWNPDFDANGDVAGAAANWGTNSLTCAGTYGCHGDHSQEGNFDAISGAHHTDDSTVNGTSVGKSYRFLKGIKGKEDADWEYTADSSDHNQYYGYDRTDDDPTNMDSASINYLCAECHGNFHSGTAAGEGADDDTFGAAWIRHPTDYDMNNVSSKEYGDYGGASNDYMTIAPVASNDVSAVKSTVLSGSEDDAIVMCLSCHRAHGSPYADLLRWDYDACVADGDNDESTCGCFACHTTK